MRADLTGADLSGADLTYAMELTQAQLDSACGDDKTMLDGSALTVPACAASGAP
jgi:uncharacterized protein YjbI with pentapeptide repeats